MKADALLNAYIDLNLLVCAGALLWLAFFSAIPHKEERFMFPIYPLLCVAAAVAVVRALRLVTKLLPPRPAPRALTNAALWRLAVGGSAALSFGRSAALVVYYGAPLPLYSDLSALLAARGGCSRAGTHTHGGTGLGLDSCTQVRSLEPEARARAMAHGPRAK